MPKFELSAESDGFICDITRKPNTMIVLLYIFKQFAKEKRHLPLSLQWFEITKRIRGLETSQTLNST